MGRRAPAKPANEVTTDFGAGPAGEKEVSRNGGPARHPSASACELYCEILLMIQRVKPR
jgi:hypothetical protein